MSKVNAFETAILLLTLENADLAAIGDATGLRGSSTAGNFYIALFTADPGEAGGIGDEATYTGYIRKAISRAGGSWTTADGASENTAAITFDACTGGTNTVTHFAICKASVAGVTDLIYYAELTAPLAVSNGITPEFAAGALDLSEG